MTARGSASAGRVCCAASSARRRAISADRRPVGCATWVRLIPGVDRFGAHSVLVVQPPVPVGSGASEVPTMGIANSQLRVDPAEAVAQVAAARRSRLLRAYRRRLRPEDLEDAYSQ